MAKNFIENISIKNFELNTPQQTTVGGTLEKFHNMRYTDFGTENVSQFKLTETITNFNSFSLIYIHLTNYLAKNDENELHHVNVVGGKIVSLQKLEETYNAASTSISHFGNTLIITGEDFQKYFIYKDNSYSHLSFNDIKPIDNVSISAQYVFSQDYNSSYHSPIYGYNESDMMTCSEYTNLIAEFNNDDYIYGATYIIVAYKLYDGSIVKNGRAIMVPTESTQGNFVSPFKRVENILFSDGKTYEYCYFKRLSASKPTISITIDPEVMGNELISSVVVYATRPEDIYDFENIHKIYESTPYSADYPDTSSDAKYFYQKDYENYTKRPFYEIEEFKNSDIESSTITFILSYKEHIEGMEFNAIFSPSFSIHSTMHRYFYEYNGRIHSYNQLTKPYGGVSLSLKDSTFDYFNETYYRTALPEGITLEYSVFIRIEDVLYEVVSGSDSYGYTNSELVSDDTAYAIPIDNFISFPDYRAEKINIYYSDGIGRHLIKSLALSPSLSNNMAYFYDTRIAMAGRGIISAFPPKFFSRKEALCSENIGIELKNKIMVSNINNPFAYDPTNTYQIDGKDCVINNVTITADEITENSFGKHPLMVFTSKGIYALEQGSEGVLYSNVVLLDKNTTSSNIKCVAYNSILYFTTGDRVMTLNSRSVTQISQPLECSSDRDKSNAINMSDYLKNAELYALTFYDEIMIYNHLYNAALIYNTNNRQWSTRSLCANPLSPTTLLGSDGILSLTDKENKNRPSTPHIVTNVIKMGVNDLKKVEYLSLVGSTTENASIDILLYGSNDLRNWHVLSRSTFTRPLSRCGSSWRYFKVELKCNPLKINQKFYLYLSAFEFKYSCRYANIVD